ncbi:MAG: YifB family Mg chelatase-like AAA ATPase [Phycisphaeraceae bacterium]|nr:YifB family Mg chelatase-like AAA ATPase [Phycisphaeraceae bacterium]
MLARAHSYLLHGIDALPCEVEIDVDLHGEKNRADVVGLPDTAVKESIERVRSAVMNSGYTFPAGRVLINLAPADVRKEGPLYDLPIAVGMLIAMGMITPPSAKRAGSGRSPSFVESLPSDLRPETSGTMSPAAPMAPVVEAATALEIDPRRYLLAGELALDGRVRPIRGVIAMAALARAHGLAGVIVPRENAPEAAVVPGVDAIGVATLTEVAALLNGQLEARPHPAVDVAEMLRTAEASIDFADVRGQESVKRAITIAAAGGHNLIMLGPAGTGKTMMARALPGILPPMTTDEALEVTRVYSAAGMLPTGPDQIGLVTVRPVRSPHHTASSAAIVGGGMIPRPGEISLAHHGVLFLDELPEFPRPVLETLRQPLEEHCVSIARAHSSVKFPASFMLVAAMNPTPKGDMPVDEFGRRAMDRYLSRLSGPLVDRIDIHVEAHAVPFKQLSGEPRGTTSAQMRESVLKARHVQRLRPQTGGVPNARLSGKQLDKVAPMSDEARTVLAQAMAELGLSARAYDKIRRVARTIADIDGSESVGVPHVAEAVSYRLLDRKS